MMAIPSHLANMIRRPVPPDSGVLHGTVPVISFGDPDSSVVATLGINPSSAEFTKNGVHLPIDQRRLATLGSLGATDPQSLSDLQVAQVVDECSSYFRNRPYKKWFDPLDEVLEAAMGCSYYDGSACHLDLVQWATDPVWGQLAPAQRNRLLEEGAPFLQTQLESADIRLVVVNGAQVWDQLSASALVQAEDVGTLPYGAKGTPTRLRVGEGCGTTFAGWTMNLQGSYGVRAEDRRSLAAWLSSVITKETAFMRSDEWYLEKETLSTKTEFAHRLREWFDQSTADTIGDVGKYPGSGLLSIELGGGRMAVLNKDTKRAAVAAYLATVDALGAEHAWRVITNSKGTINKLEFTVSGPATPGWYCYLTPNADNEGTL